MSFPIQPLFHTAAAEPSTLRRKARRLAPIFCLATLLAVAGGTVRAADLPSQVAPPPRDGETVAKAKPASAPAKAKGTAPAVSTAAKSLVAAIPTAPAKAPTAKALVAAIPTAPADTTAPSKTAPAVPRKGAAALAKTARAASAPNAGSAKTQPAVPAPASPAVVVAATSEPAAAADNGPLPDVDPLHSGQKKPAKDTIDNRGQVADTDPLPSKSPERFNPDPGGHTAPLTNKPPDAAPVVPNLFEPVLPPPPTDYGTDQHPVPYKLRLPRTALVTNELVNESIAYPQYELSEGNIGLLPNAVPQTNRWRIPFGQYPRYDSNVETPYRDGPLRFFDPFKASLLKGDSPIIGQDIFLSLTFEDQLIAEFRRTPVGSNVSSARASSNDFFGRSESYTLQNNLSSTIELFRGETAFKPIDWAVHITPIFNINFSEFKENGIVDPDPRGPNYTAFNPEPTPTAPTSIVNPGDVGTTLTSGTGSLKHVGQDDFGRTRYTQRTRETLSIEEAFVEIHLRDVSENYDFISARVGNQLLNSDFRGFIFNDTNTGARIFGNYDNNHLQYNLAVFNQREKDTFSGLNEYSARGQDVIVANVYRQDALNLFLPASDNLALGYTAQLSFHANLDHGQQHYDKTDVLVRPAPIGGPIAEHDVNTAYFGFAGDGHIGWLNLTHAFYEVVGRDDKNGIAGRAVDVNAQMFALELSRDYDFLRPKFSLLYASGDSNPRDRHATGFDSIEDSPTFIGNPFSFYARQGFGLANAAILAKPGNTLLLDLRTSKSEGQANYVNPGTFIVGFGLDADLTPKLRLQFNANYIRMVNSAPVKVALFTNQVDPELGYDISLGFTYRPLLNENIIINAGFGAFLPGRGYRDIYREVTNPVPGFTVDPSGEIDSFLYSGLIAITLRY